MRLTHTYYAHLTCGNVPFSQFGYFLEFLSRIADDRPEGTLTGYSVLPFWNPLYYARDGQDA